MEDSIPRFLLLDEEQYLHHSFQSSGKLAGVAERERRKMTFRTCKVRAILDYFEEMGFDTWVHLKLSLRIVLTGKARITSIALAPLSTSCISFLGGMLHLDSHLATSHACAPFWCLFVQCIFTQRAFSPASPCWRDGPDTSQDARGPPQPL